jgi:hypothetical protein
MCVARFDELIRQIKGVLFMSVVIALVMILGCIISLARNKAPAPAPVVISRQRRAFQRTTGETG